MSRLTIAFVMALAATAANAQNTSLDNRTRQPLPARMEHGRSYLMDACEVMASSRERSPTIISSTLEPLSCHREQASLGANDESRTVC